MSHWAERWQCTVECQSGFRLSRGEDYMVLMQAPAAVTAAAAAAAAV
jgi:hypothetical protein